MQLHCIHCSTLLLRWIRLCQFLRSTTATGSTGGLPLTTATATTTRLNLDYYGYNC